jgi:hypothetical protein
MSWFSQILRQVNVNELAEDKVMDFIVEYNAKLVAELPAAADKYSIELTELVIGAVPEELRDYVAEIVGPELDAALLAYATELLAKVTDDAMEAADKINPKD